MKPRPVEPLLVLAFAVVAPLAAWGALAAHGRSRPLPAAPPPPLAVLATAHEDRERGPRWWLSLAGAEPELFTTAVRFCTAHARRPLPNCRSVAAARRARVALGGSRDVP